MKYKVYKTILSDGRYYYGYSGKTGKEWDNYFGSSKIVKEYKGVKAKQILYSYDNKNYAQYRELLLQIESIDDPKCLNGLLYVRIVRKNLSGFRLTNEKDVV